MRFWQSGPEPKVKVKTRVMTGQNRAKARVRPKAPTSHQIKVRVKVLWRHAAEASPEIQEEKIRGTGSVKTRVKAESNLCQQRRSAGLRTRLLMIFSYKAM